MRFNLVDGTTWGFDWTQVRCWLMVTCKIRAGHPALTASISANGSSRELYHIAESPMLHFK